MDEVEFLDLYCCQPPGGDKGAMSCIFTTDVQVPVRTAFTLCECPLAHVAPVADVSRDTPTPSSLALSAAQGTKDRDMVLDG